jgi:putative ABC transport system permease protein
VQFAILVGLIVTTATLWRQTQFALGKGLGPADGKLILSVFAPCASAFPEEVRKLPGVAAAACSSAGAINIPNAQGLTSVQLGGGRTQFFDQDVVGLGFFEVYGVKPLAGRLFQADHGADRLLQDNPMATGQPSVIINETAARDLGFSDPRAAVGRAMSWSRFKPGDTPDRPPAAAPSTIIGVVPDMPVTVRTATDPTFYFVMPPQRLGTLSVRLTGQDVPGTVRGIQDAWKRTGNGQPIAETFLSQFRLTLYLDLITQDTTIAVCAGLAILIACLGLFALSAYTTERRTKEIGVRKAMGADTRAVVLLLLWQFTAPVVLASAIAIPLGLWGMSWWLRGFVYHAPLSPWTFVLAPLAAVAIAWLTVSWQSFAVARAKPAGALRYE